jgi:HK97 gp10 family phage protein
MAMQGRESMLRKLKAIQGLPRTRMKEALNQNAQEISDAQKRLVSVDDGDLRRSIGYTFGDYRPENSNVRGVSSAGGGDPDLTVTIHAGDAKAFYAAFIEFGTQGPYTIKGRFEGATHPGIRAQPFFYGPYRAYRKRAKSRLTRAMRKAIRESIA